MPFRFHNSDPHEPAPDYDQVVIGNPRGDRTRSPSDDSSSSNLHPSTSEVAIDQRIVYTYHLNAGSTHLQMIIAVVPVGRHSDLYTFSLSVKAGGVERTLCEPIVIKLFLGPRQLDFAAFIFPPKVSLPANCLYCIRVWLRSSQVDHQLFAENEFWLAKDPDFRTIGDASYAQLTSNAPFMQVYQAYVGRAQISFIVRWHRLEGDTYKLSLEYEAAGVGRILFDDMRLRLECDPQAIGFVIYSVPISSTPPNASHRLRFWIRTPSPSQSPSSSAHSLQSMSYIFQRIWKSDNFKVGSQLNFEALGSKMVMGVPDARGPQVESNSQRLPAPRRSQWNSQDGAMAMSYSDDKGATYL